MVLVGALTLTSASVLMQQACLDGGMAEARTRNTELDSGQCPMHGGAVMASDQQALGGNWGWAARRMFVLLIVRACMHARMLGVL